MKAGSAKPYRRNLAVWIALLALLAATAGSAFIPMGAWNGVANLAIAALKTLLVGIFFMHLRDAGALVRLAAAVAAFMLVLLFALASTDYFNRRMHAAPWQEPRQVHPALPRTRPKNG
ncbi:MAG TPA: cytochrome C oxidase subunit IV family protein [Rhodocyclaceae bacterium]|nr:cytochrome C oxidase subunit IV family protein [Rhodocyclaceae bacterium]